MDIFKQRMEIGSGAHETTQRHKLPPKKEVSPEPEDGLSFTGKLDKDLSHGIIPRDLKFRSGEDKVKENKSRFITSLIADSVAGGMFGGALGFILLGGAILPIGAAAVGAGIGIGMALKKGFFQKSGKVKIELDGKKTEQKYYLNPHNYKKDPEMIKASLIADGALGDKISAHVFKSKDIPQNGDPSRLEALKGHAKDLVDLGKTRRLLASFGDKSAYGKEVLNLIDANMAKDLLAAGKAIYVVDGQGVSKIPHHYKATASNKSQTTIMQEAFDYQENKFDYGLTKISSPNDLSKVKKAKGLPEGILGVYKDSDSYSEVVFTDKQYGYGKVEKVRGGYSEDLDYEHSTKKKVSKADIEVAEDVEPTITQRMDLSRLTTFIGVFAGTMASLAVTPPVAAAVIVGGGFLGHAIGKLLNRFGGS